MTRFGAQEVFRTMAFHSILFDRADDRITKETLEPPAFFLDLNLDQIIDAITAGKQEYNLKPFFYTSLKDIDTITYRHEVMRDLENPVLFATIKSSAQRMGEMRAHLAQAEKLYYQYQKESWFLDAVQIYCDAVNCLAHDLVLADLQSRGLLAFREYLADYAASARFTSLLAATQRLKADLATVRYCLLIKENRFTVRKYESAIDYSAAVEDTFAKFKQGAVKDYRVTFSTRPEMNHVEAKALDFVAQLYPDTLSRLASYCVKNRTYLDERIRVFDREIQFYVAYLEYGEIFRRAGLQLCYPQLSDRGKEIYDYEGFDLALAYKLISEKHSSAVVCNDFYLKGPERIFVVSGPNQGGKTTFARTFGQLHYLGGVGCPVPGREARLFLFDKLFTHFDKEENIKDLRGSLEDDLLRIHAILDDATPNSSIIINEIFTSTALQDAVVLSKRIMERLMQLDVLCVCVTFIDELASLSEKTVSMVSTIVPDNPTLRTYKIVRRPADGLSYAIAIAQKYRLTYDRLKERLTS